MKIDMKNAYKNIITYAAYAINSQGADCSVCAEIESVKKVKRIAKRDFGRGWTIIISQHTTVEKNGIPFDFYTDVIEQFKI